MNNTGSKGDRWLLEIDFDLLMDLRIDYAFKLLFSKGDQRLLISLLNAVFANKRIKRVIKSLTIKNPYLDKESDEDKQSILDIRAELDDGTTILIEMHMYGLGELKAKTIRSWARVFGQELEVGENYAGQPPTITIAFANGQIEPIEKVKNRSNDKIHRLCKIMDCEDFIIFTDAMELHYIDMKAFVKEVNETGNINVGDAEEIMFAKWLSIITQKEINNKKIIENICKDGKEIQMAISELARHGEDKITRQAYQRRQDEIYFYNKEKFEYNRKLEEKDNALAEKDNALAQKDNALAEKDSALAEKDNELAEKDAIIAELRSRLGEK